MSSLFQIENSSQLGLRFALIGALLLTVAGCGGTGAMSSSDMAAYAISRGDDEDDEEDEDDGGARAAAPAAVSQPSTNGRPSLASNADSSEATSAPVESASTSADNTSASPQTPVAADTPTATTSTVSSTNPSSISASPATTSAITTANTTALGNETAASPMATSASASAAPNATLPNATQPNVQSIAGILPIENRVPEQPLAVAERRKISAENVQKITTALVQWIESKPIVQTSIIRDQVRRPGLSWRVAILPLLGYEELYKKFNLKEPWDGPTNKPLLKFIPPEFTSPDRFDEYTNYQLFVNGTALFSEKETKHRSEISDAPSVLLMAEFDDAVAVPWTSPFDYDVTEEPLDRGLGNLREDGAFVGWLTGQAALWPKPINRGILFKALTFEAGDNVNFSQFMGYPPESAGGSNRPSFGDQRPSNALAASSASGNITSSNTAGASTTTSRDTRKNPSVPGVARQPMPPRDKVLEAQAKIRETYEVAFKQAQTPVEFSKLAQLVYSQVTGSQTRTKAGDDNDRDDNSVSVGESNMPPAELYVGLRTAFILAVKGRDPNLAVQLVEELDQRFEIDRADFESRMFKGFLGKGGSLRTELSKASILIPQLEDLIAVNIDHDDYRRAEENLEYGMAAIRHINDRETNYRWRIMKERVEEGKRRFPTISKHIETLSTSPENPEANLAVGWYLCLVKENWIEGAKLLAKSKDPSLRALALLEIQQESGFNRHVTLGDGWWNYGQTHKDDALVFQASMERARTWYTSASDGLRDGLDRIRANNRLDAIDRMIGRPPELLNARARGNRRAL